MVGPAKQKEVQYDQQTPGQSGDSKEVKAWAASQLNSGQTRRKPAWRSHRPWGVSRWVADETHSVTGVTKNKR